MAPLVQPDYSQAMTPNRPGTFVCQIISSEVKFGQQSGAPYMNWKLQTVPEGRTVFHSTPLEGKGAGMFKHMIHSAGDTNYTEGPYDTDRLNGKTVSMKLTLDDKGYFVVREVTPASTHQSPAFAPQPRQTQQPVNNTALERIASMERPVNNTAMDRRPTPPPQEEMDYL